MVLFWPPRIHFSPCTFGGHQVFISPLLSLVAARCWFLFSYAWQLPSFNFYSCTLGGYQVSMIVFLFSLSQHLVLKLLIRFTKISWLEKDFIYYFWLLWSILTFFSLHLEVQIKQVANDSPSLEFSHASIVLISHIESIGKQGSNFTRSKVATWVLLSQGPFPPSKQNL